MVDDELSKVVAEKYLKIDTISNAIWDCRTSLITTIKYSKDAKLVHKEYPGPFNVFGKCRIAMLLYDIELSKDGSYARIRSPLENSVVSDKLEILHKFDELNPRGSLIEVIDPDGVNIRRDSIQKL